MAIDAVFDARIGDISGRGKLATDMREIWMMQTRFERRTGSGVYSLVEQPRYRAGYDFLRLRADAGEVEGTLADWWDDFAQGNEEERSVLLNDAREATKQQPRRVPKTHQVPRKEGVSETRAAPADDGEEADEGQEGGVETTSAPKKRRRRRKPKSASGSGAAAAE